MWRKLRKRAKNRWLLVMELGVGRLESGDEAVRCVGTDGKQMGHFFFIVLS